MMRKANKRKESDMDFEEKKILDNLLGNCTDIERQQKLQELTEWLLYGTS